MNNMIIYHHLGLGDHIICNGLVRNFYKRYGSVDLFCYANNEANVKYMYRDLKNLNTIPVSSDQEADSIIIKNNFNVLKIGFENLYMNKSSEPFDIEFYKMVDLLFSSKFDNFYLERDMEKELFILKDLNPNNEPYIFIHGDLDMSKIKKDFKIINNPKEYSLFNLISLFENAEEIHVMESSLKCLINQYKLNKPKLFYHNYVKYCSEFYNTKGLNTYKVIN